MTGPTTSLPAASQLEARLQLVLHPAQGDVRRAELVACGGEVVAAWAAAPGSAAADLYEAVAHVALALAGVTRGSMHYRVDLGSTPRRGSPGSRDSCLRVWETVLSGSSLAAARLAQAYLAMDEARLREVSRLADGDAHLQASARWALHKRGEDRALGRLRCAQEWAELGWVDARELSSLHVATLRTTHDGSGAPGDPVRDAVIRHWCAVAEREAGSVQDDAGPQRAPTDAEVEEARTVLAQVWNDARRRHSGSATRGTRAGDEGAQERSRDESEASRESKENTR